MNTSNAPATHPHQFRQLARRLGVVVALCALVATLTTTWLTSSPASAGPKPTAPRAKAAPAARIAPAAARDDGDDQPRKTKAPKSGKSKQALAGKLNLNTATVDQLQLLPGVGQSKAERVITWRQKNGGFKRVADLRKVKGFGYKSLKKLEPYLEVKGENSLASK